MTRRSTTAARKASIWASIRSPACANKSRRCCARRTARSCASRTAALDTTIKRLSDYYRFQTGSDSGGDVPPLRRQPAFDRALSQTTSSFYAIVSNSGKAMFIDYGSASGPHFGNFERATAVDRPHPLCRAQHRPAQARIRREIGGSGHAQPHARRPHERLPAPDPPLRREDLVLREHGGHLPEPARAQSRLHAGRAVSKYRAPSAMASVSNGRSMTSRSPTRRDIPSTRWRCSPPSTATVSPSPATPSSCRIRKNDGTLRHNLIFRNHVRERQPSEVDPQPD